MEIVSMRGGSGQGASRARRSQQVVRLEGDYWSVDYAGGVFRMKDSRGMRYLATLLTRPGERIAAWDIESWNRGDSASRRVQPNLGEDMERARVNVTRALKSALQRIAVHHPELAEHLRATLRTGAFCVYLPDPRLRTRWEK